ncbi:MAG TPA: alpha-D-ribose 1-methylphosphonate 5-triphosphate diphosphatase [Hyphomicrobiales bacterium]|nr:alpha-D-ribose 1-methylphosphonate 5-triphosphate diphosphatase [Hyphomicrobiales bacterium]
MTATATELVLTNARIVLVDGVVEGTLVARDGRVAEISEGSVAAGIDCAGDYLVPGLVELHTDHLESHYAPRPGVRWNPIAAIQAHDAQIVSSGITTVFDALRVGSDADSKQLGREMRTLAVAIDGARGAGRLRADHLIHLRCELSASDAAEEAEPFFADPNVRLVSLMDHTPGQRQFVRLDKFKEYYQGKSGMSDTEMDAFIEERLRMHSLYSAANRSSVVAACNEAGIVLASHDDATPAHVREAIGDGVAIAEFPTTVEAARVAHENGLKVLMGAPNVVRGGSHSGNVSALELAHQGLLDVLSSDYVPFSLVQAAFVLPRLARELSLADAIRLVTANPAEAVGLADRGRLEPGRRADIVRVADDGSGVPIVREVWREGRRVA